MRNEIFSQNSSQDKIFRLDIIYGESQAYIGEIFLVTENNALATTINEFNERFYRQNWTNLDLTTTNQTIETLKTEGLALIAQMREDIQESTILSRNDLFHIWSGITNNKKPV